MKQGKWRQTQVVLHDLTPWLEQLYDEHRVRVELQVALPLPDDHISPAVTLRAFQVRPGGERIELATSWETVSRCTTGGIEQAALRLTSRLLLDLESDADRVDAQQAPLWTY